MKKYLISLILGTSLLLANDIDLLKEVTNSKISGKQYELNNLAMSKVDGGYYRPVHHNDFTHIYNSLTAINQLNKSLGRGQSYKLQNRLGGSSASTPSYRNNKSFTNIGNGSKAVRVSDLNNYTRNFNSMNIYEQMRLDNLFNGPRFISVPGKNYMIKNPNYHGRF